MRRLVLLLSLFAVNAVAQTPVTEPVYGPAAGDQTAPVVASNGTDFLVARLDGRGMPGTIYTNRVTGAGRLLDGTGIRVPIPFAPGGIRLLGAFHIGGAYAIVFNTQRWVQEGTSTRALYPTYVARISDDGRLLSDPQFLVEDFFPWTAAANATRIVITGEGPYAIADEKGDLLERGTLPVSGNISAAQANQHDVSLVAPSRAAFDRVSIEPEYGRVSRVSVRDVVTPLRRRPSL